MSYEAQYPARNGEAARSEPVDRKRQDSGIGVVIFVISIVGVIAFGWAQRNSGLINPERGLGYMLGLAGALLMLALLLYPLRKRFKGMAGLGRVATWFRLHMVLGIAGPTLVVLHSNFELKSTNASVALYSMLIVAGSGIVGRYLYARIHRGVYGRRIEARELIGEAAAFRASFGEDLGGEEWRGELQELERATMHQPHGIFSAIARSWRIRARAERTRKALLEDARQTMEYWAQREGWSSRSQRMRLAEARDHIDRYNKAVRRAAELAIFERLFAAWHILHLPLFLMLILTAAIHVFAVHMY